MLNKLHKYTVVVATQVDDDNEVLDAVPYTSEFSIVFTELRIRAYRK